MSIDRKNSTIFLQSPNFQILIYSVALMVTIVWRSINRGVDINWDLKNYHLYAPFLALNRRWDIDHFPASLQTTINPTLDILLTYPLYKFAPAFLVPIVVGIVHGLLPILIFFIAIEFFKRIPGLSNIGLYFFSFLVALTGSYGANTNAQIGTSFGDYSSGIIVLGGILLFFKLRGFKKWIFFGLFSGLATGLKLTNAIYLVSNFLVATATLVWMCRLQAIKFRELFSSLSAFSFAALIGIVVTHGWWSLILFDRFGNPLFPFYNGIFKSPHFSLTDFEVPIFFPVNWMERIFYPFFFTWKSRVSELPFRDYRFVLSYVISVAVLVCEMVRRCRSKCSDSLLLIVTAWVCVAYLVWQNLFSIYRYALVIESLIPMFITFVIFYIVPLRFVKLRQVFVLLICTALIKSTVWPDWGHVRVNGKEVLQVTADGDDLSLEELRGLFDNSNIFLGQPPLGYLPALVTNLDLNVHWIGKSFSQSSLEAATNKVDPNIKHLVLFKRSKEDHQYILSMLKNFNIELPHGPPCKMLHTNFNDEFLLCEIVSTTSSSFEFNVKIGSKPYFSENYSSISDEVN